MARNLIPTTLVAGGSAQARETWIFNDLQRIGDQQSTALLLEGLPSGRSELDALSFLSINRSAPGCLCCTGNLVMRVNLNKLLRQAPARLYIGVAPGTHLDTLATTLTALPYSEWMFLEQTISL